jgi:hypothetical protein
MDAHPRIVFRDGPVGRRPAVAGGPDVWEIISAFDPGSRFTDAEIERVARSLALTSVQVRAAADYYAQYREEIDDWIRRNDELAERHEREWLRQREPIAG